MPTSKDDPKPRNCSVHTLKNPAQYVSTPRELGADMWYLPLTYSISELICQMATLSSGHCYC